jgi:hypothetical protein
MKLKHTAIPIALVALAVPLLVVALPKGAFQGQPSFSPGSATGAFVWTDAAGLHARFTSKDGLTRFHGKACASGKIAALETVTLEAGDSAAVGPRGHCVLFNFVNKGHIDGFDFKATGRSLTFDLKKGPHQLAPSKIWIGAKGLHPAASPFVLKR